MASYTGYESFISKDGTRKLEDFETFETTLDDIIDELSKLGWEDAEDVMKTTILIENDETKEIVAIGSYIPNENSEYPSLRWTINKTGGTITRVYEVEYAEHIADNRQPG